MRLKSKLGVVTIGVVAATTAGVAFAAWTSTGSGTGSAASTTSVDSEISPGTLGVDLYPGANEPVQVSITNPNDYPVEVTSISAGASQATGEAEDCDDASVFSDAVGDGSAGVLQSDGSTTIAAGGSGTYTLRVRMIGDAHDACKDQTFTLVDDPTVPGSELTATLSSVAVTAS